MPVARINGINLSFDDYGVGAPVLLVTGTGAPGRVWRTHQVPALRAAGYRVITMDNRGIPPSDAGPEGFTLADMVADTAALIEHLGVEGCRVVGFSLGAMIVQELLVARPRLVGQAVLMATRGRSDALATAMSLAEIELYDSGVTVPARYAAFMHALQSLSPRTLNDERQIRDWLDVFEVSAVTLSAARGQLGLELIPDRRPGFAHIQCPCLVIGFQDDLIVRPPLCREVADAIPGATYEEIPGCGHYGYLERPTEVNSAILGFFARQTTGAVPGQVIVT
ncbi:alpha/beta fold hydrolase [Frankia sp. BMG5.23]|uniref:alpha/beta fold hydrolase n=1 Tax=Frankia sp. BMG5.23 TaxID=683305 RepID=UPI00046180F6|nr:alpha/beta hydrolase [Frankia sp. BMG5.23]KDA42758.1 putative hydrolase or acyltransferase of alpha/beta superfamily [Frankia sp. BMG5.23]